jgi:hypothetical protein
MLLRLPLQFYYNPQNGSIVNGSLALWASQFFPGLLPGFSFPGTGKTCDRTLQLWSCNITGSVSALLLVGLF